MKLREIIAEINPTDSLVIVERMMCQGGDIFAGGCVYRPDTQNLYGMDGDDYSLEAEYDKWELGEDCLIVWEKEN